jgi:hypothetical protein
MWSWLALPLLVLCSGCPDGGGRDGGIGGGSSATIVYRADQTTPNSFEIFLVDSGARLNPGPLAAPRTVHAFAITPDKNSVVYIADQDSPGTKELYRVLFAASGVSLKLNPTLANGRQVSEVVVAPDSRSAIYRANETVATAVELYRSFFATAGTSTKLNGTLVSGGNVTSFAVR